MKQMLSLVFLSLLVFGAPAFADGPVVSASVQECPDYLRLNTTTVYLSTDGTVAHAVWSKTVSSSSFEWATITGFKVLRLAAELSNTASGTAASVDTVVFADNGAAVLAYIPMTSISVQTGKTYFIADETYIIKVADPTTP